MIGNRDGDAVDRRTQNDGRCVIGAAFELLDHVGALEPVRLLDLAEATGIPGPTVHRLLKQLIEVGAVRREGTRYRLGASLLDLGARVTPERRLRAVARLPLAELAAGRSRSAWATRTGQPGTAGISCPAPIVDAGGYLAHISCVAVAVPLGRGEVAAVTTLVAGQRPSVALLAATRAAGTRIAALLNAPARTMDDSSQNSIQWKMGRR
jgi:DNA-binding Lrp family transcriptional regulator